MLRRPISRLTTRKSFGRRALHDNGVFGLHQPRASLDESFTSEELANRARNASLLRLVESYRRHGHRAARLDPLDLVERPSVPALDPRRYGFSVEQNVRDDFQSATLPAQKIASSSEPIDTRGILDFPLVSVGIMEVLIFHLIADLLGFYTDRKKQIMGKGGRSSKLQRGLRTFTVRESGTNLCTYPKRQSDVSLSACWNHLTNLQSEPSVNWSNGGCSLRQRHLTPGLPSDSLRSSVTDSKEPKE